VTLPSSNPERAAAARSHHDQIGSLLISDLCDHVRRASCRHIRQLERRVETFLLQVLHLVPDRGLNFVLDAPQAARARELVYVHDDEPGTVSLREALEEGNRLVSFA
jgi:hypothetical protein